MAPTKPAFGLASVQELAKEPKLTIPNKYLRSDQESPVTLSNRASMPTIPIIDMKRLLAGEATELELENFNSSCKDWGMFQLVNHGVNKQVVEKLKHEIEEFYKLPLIEKMKYQVTADEVEGYGQTILMQQKDDQKVDWSDRFYMTVNPPHRRKDHLFPNLPPSLREALEDYISALQGLSKIILGLMAKALKIEEKEMEIFEDGMQSVRMTYYPPCPEPQKVIGLIPHSDASGITILLEVNGVGGLQVKKDGVWIPVDFLPDAFLVNVGDCLEILSNGLYKSFEHKVTANSVKERISMAMFFNPKFEAEIGPATTILNNQNPPLFKTVTAADYYHSFFTRKLSGKTNIEAMKIENEDIYK